MRRARRKIPKAQLVAMPLLLAVAVVLLLPIAFTLFYSFFPRSEMNALISAQDQFDPNKWISMPISPKMATLRQYYVLMIENPLYLQLFVNSVIYAFGILAGQAVVVPMMAYGLSCFRFRGRETLFFLIIMLMLLPFQVTLVPSVLTLRFVGLLDTPWAILLPMWFAPFYIFLLRQFMVGIPGELFEAGMMDGAGPMRCFLHIMLPVCRPILGAALALSFADSWNMVEQPLVFLQNNALMPLSVMFRNVADQSAGKDVAFAGAALYLLPPLLIYVYFQEDILLGVQLSELK